jgi:hypothetical protein
MYISYSDATSSLDFGALHLTFLTSNNAQLVGSTVQFAESSNSFNAKIVHPSLS